MKKAIAVCIVLFVILFSVSASDTWEYFILIIPGPVKLSPFPTDYMPSVTDRFWTFPKVTTALNDLGSDGWEVVSSVFDPSGNYIITLKKAIRH